MLLSAVVGGAATLLAAHWNLIKPSDNQVEKLYERLEAERRQEMKGVQQELAAKAVTIDELRQKIADGDSKLRVCEAREPQAKACPPSSAASEMKNEPDRAEKPADHEIIDIDWSTNAESWVRRLGQRFKFRCPGNGVSNEVSGTTMYTWDSSICTAAVHAGKIKGDAGGIVTVRIYGAGEAENGSTTNGVRGKPTRQNVPSFVFE